MKKLLLSALAAGLGFTGCEGQDLPAGPEETTVKTAEFDTPWGRLPLRYEEREGRAIHQGDIDLGPVGEQGDRLRANVRSVRSFRWPLGVVPFENTILNPDGTDNVRIAQAISHWETLSAVRFLRSNSAPDRVKFVGVISNEGLSAAGRQMGVQTITIGNQIDTVSVAHEIGHAVGLWHEQSRADRDMFVDIFPTCIQAGKMANFDKVGSLGVDIGLYDHISLMHYLSTAYLDTTKKLPNGQPCTMTIRQKDGANIPVHMALSSRDLDALKGIYGERGATRIGSPASQMVADSNGTLSAASPDGRTVFRFDGTSNWSNIGTPGGTGRILALRAGGSQLFGVNLESRDIFRYNGGQSWVKVGDAGFTFAVDSVGTLYGVSADSRNVTRWSGSGTTWANLTSPNSQPVSNIFAGGSNLFATAASSGDIYKWQGGTSWTKVGGPGNSFAVLKDGTLFGLSSDRSAVWQWSGSGQNWTPIGGPASSIAGGGDGLVAINSLNEIWKFTAGVWRFLNLGPVITPVAPGGENLFVMAQSTLDVYSIQK